MISSCQLTSLYLAASFITLEIALISYLLRNQKQHFKGIIMITKDKNDAYLFSIIRNLNMAATLSPNLSRNGNNVTSICPSNGPRVFKSTLRTKQFQPKQQSSAILLPSIFIPSLSIAIIFRRTTVTWAGPISCISDIKLCKASCFSSLSPYMSTKLKKARTPSSLGFKNIAYGNKNN